MPVVPNLLNRTYMLRLNRGPGPMLDLFGGIGLEAAMVALDVGLFEALRDDPGTPGEVAARIDADETGVETLLGYLDRAGYVTERGGKYGLAAMTERWLLEDSETSYARYFRFWREVVYPFWREHAADAVLEGEPPVSLYEWLDEHPDRWPVAQAAFEMTADLIGDDIAAELDPPEGGSVLDVGGGHALYSVAVCERYPSVTATVFDDPAVADIAAKNVATAGLGDRVEFVAGNYESDPLPDANDAALVFNVVHGNDRGTNRRLFESVADALAPGGQVAVLDQFGDESRAAISNTGTRFLDLTYHVTLGGRTYHTDAVTEWLADAGFGGVDRHEFRERHMTVLVAEKQ